MILVVGAAGAAGSGKDTVADYLVERHGFVKFSFSDALYREVVDAFNLEDDARLRDRETKERPLFDLTPARCRDRAFGDLAAKVLEEQRPDLRNRLAEIAHQPLSPRFVLQLWGTEYRRAQDSDYWVRSAHGWLSRMVMRSGSPNEMRFINTSVRFNNEAALIREAWKGAMWHLRRPNGPAADNASHVSEKPLLIRFGDHVIENVSSVPHLHERVDVALRQTLREKLAAA